MQDRVNRVLKLYEIEEIHRVFDKCESSVKDGFLSIKDLKMALAEFDVMYDGDAASGGFDELKRILLQPSEAEEWIQMMPLASLLARSLGVTSLDGLEHLQDDEVHGGLRVFSDCVTILLQRKLLKLKIQNKKMQDLPSGESKFGGKLEGGTVEDFHHGLTDRLGKFSLMSWLKGFFTAKGSN